MLNLRLLATGKALPSWKISSADLDQMLGQPSGYVLQKSGIDHRYHASAGETQSGLGALALRDALARAQLRPDAIDLLLCAAAVPEQALPCTAVRIAEHGGLPAGTPAFDVNASCLSFLAALHLAACLLQAGGYRRIAVVGCDLASRGIDWDDPEASLIFGDGAAAAIVEHGDGPQGIEGYRLETYPAGKSFCEIRAGGTQRNPRMGSEDGDYLFRMNGRRVFRMASALMDGFIGRLLGSCATPLALDDIDLVVPHQASHLAMQHIGKQLKLPASRIVDIYRTHGNQVAASLPCALHEAIDSGRLQRGGRALLLGTAAGLSIGGLLLRL